MKLFVNGREVECTPSDAEIQPMADRLAVRTSEGSATAVAVRDGDSVLISYQGRQYRIERRRPVADAHGGVSSGEIRAPMPGLIVDVLVKQGAAVGKGDKILVLEAMKTQQAFAAPFQGIVASLSVSKGDQVVDGALLAVVSPTDEAK